MENQNPHDQNSKFTDVLEKRKISTNALVIIKYARAYQYFPDDYYQNSFRQVNNIFSFWVAISQTSRAFFSGIFPTKK